MILKGTFVNFMNGLWDDHEGMISRSTGLFFLKVHTKTKKRKKNTTKTIRTKHILLNAVTLTWIKSTKQQLRLSCFQPNQQDV